MQYIWVEGRQAGFDKALAVRYTVFVTEQGYSEDSELKDAQDDSSLHIVAMDEGETPVATARLFSDDKGDWHIGRVAVLKSARGRGVGLAMMQEAVKKAGELGAERIVLGAQADKTAFYERLGFTCYGDIYLDEGNPHIMMERFGAKS